MELYQESIIDLLKTLAPNPTGKPQNDKANELKIKEENTNLLMKENIVKVKRIRKEKIEKEKKDEKIIVNIINKICLGLQEIHEHNIIHRDLKPENIFINKKNEIKIGDFGISKKLYSTMNATTNNIGTINYMEQEIITQEKYDKRRK